VKVDWEDDWPVFNGENNVTLVTQGHSEKVAKEVPDVWLADLSQPELELGWYNKREFHPKIETIEKLTTIQDTPLKPCYSLTARPGHLRIYGNCHSLSSPEAPALLLRKQKSFCETFSARLEFKPSRMGYEAGIVAFWNMHTYLSIGLTPDGRGGTMLTVSGPDSNDVTVTINVRIPCSSSV
jgi:beta-xylosidase